MIVCHCFGTTDREIRTALGPNGTGHCPAGHGCGNCMRAVVDIATQAHRRPTTTSGSGEQTKGVDRARRS